MSRAGRRCQPETRDTGESDKLGVGRIRQFGGELALGAIAGQQPDRETGGRGSS